MKPKAISHSFHPAENSGSRNTHTKDQGPPFPMSLQLVETQGPTLASSGFSLVILAAMT